jgi:putative addiction module component (TIGR02574 family)
MLPIMASSFHTVAIEALNLGEADRLRLAAELIDSVEGPADPAWERAWSAELDRRAAAADARELRGESRGIPWSEVRAGVLKRLAER